MEEVRQQVQEEGREARNLVAFHVAVDTPSRVARRPPRGVPPPRRVAPRSAARLRSASAGRDKRSEFRARYWALLFGDLQRAVGEIYSTVETHENQNECQEVILVLENYTRDFKALSEWFRLKWEYDNTPPPQRPQSLTWEIRKTNFARPESRRTYSVKSSPSVSGKNSPCLSGHNTPSGKNSPNLTGKASPGSGKISPRISGPSTSPKGSTEFFSNKIASKTATKPEPKTAKEPRLFDIKEKDAIVIENDKKVEKGNELKEKDYQESTKIAVETKIPKESPNATMPSLKDIKEPAKSIIELEKSKNSPKSDTQKEKDGKESAMPIVEIGKAKEIPNVTPKPVIIKTTKRGRSITEEKKASSDTELSSQGKATTSKLDAMENEFLIKNLSDSAAKNENLLNQDFEKDKIVSSTALESSIEVTVTTDSMDKSVMIPESPSKSDKGEDKSNGCSNFVDKNTVAPITKDTKPGDEAKVLSTAENKAKTSAPKKKDTIISSVKKDPALKVVKEVPSKDAKVSEAKDKKESSQKNTKETKPETLKKDDAHKENQDDQKLNWAEHCEEDLKTNNEDKIVANGNLEEKKESVSDGNGKKPDAKSPEPCIDSKDIKKDDKDSKKGEPKPVEARLPARPAYSQAAAKPKLVTVKDEMKTPTKTLYRSKTVVDICPSSSTNRQPRQFPNKNQKSKCSYPFNLTTGRTSLFDAPGVPKVVAAKRPTNRLQLAAGDTRNQIKPDLKTRPPRPNSLKIHEQGEKREPSNSAFENMKDCDEYSSSDTIVTQIDMSRIESSESLKTIVPEYEAANSVEVLNVEDKTDNEGWLTVKSRRLSRESKKSKSHWANRFHQPSATTSLPTLNMIESPKSESNPIVDSKLDRAKSEQPQNKPEKVVQVTVKTEPKASTSKDASMIRQKSDVTGLKTGSSRNKALRRDKNRDKRGSELTKNRLHSSLESLTTGLARSQESTEDDAFDFDKWKAEFMNTFKYLEEDDQMTNHNEILKSADPSEMSEIAEMTSQIEENERKISLALDFQSEADQKKLCQEEDLLNRQIMELQQVSDNDLDTETDDTETDAEVLSEDSAVAPSPPENVTCRDLESCLENHYESALQGMSWSERLDVLGVLEELVARDPGRAQQLHAKLSVGGRRRGSLQDVLRGLQAKQARAARQRGLLRGERAGRIHQLLGRVEEVKMAKNQLIEEKRNRMERRLQKAAENRDQHLKDIVRKAHDEEEKLREIAFIKQLEAENRRHEFLEQCRSLTTRLREMRRERLDKLEQKAAREAAVGARRQALEAARKLHVEGLLEKRKERDARREELKELKRQERDDAAREKAEGVKSRLSALAAAASQEADALRSRIRDKQDASQQRLESHLQAIREKATGPRAPTTSESQEQATTKEQDEEVARIEQERKERERQKGLKKRARKLKLKLLASSTPSQLKEGLPAHMLLHPALGKITRVVTQVTTMIQPLLLDSNTTACYVNHDGVKSRKTDTTEPEFRYDFEDKMGKKKKKKKADNQNNQKKGNETKKNSKQTDGAKNDNNNGAQKTDNPKLTKTQTHIESNGTPNEREKKRKNAENETQIKNDTQANKNDTQANKNDTQANKNDAQTDKSQRLSKSNSICSSVSDMSKASNKNDKPMISVDISHLEKLISDLNRITASKDCNDNIKMPSLLEPVVLMKIQAVTTLGLLLALLAEREDVMRHLSYKSVEMVVSSARRLISLCKRVSLHFFESPAAVHMVTLLQYQLGRDQSDHKELELAMHICDLVSTCLDSAFCATHPKWCDSDDATTTAIRARAHNLVSYICLSGCITLAENAGAAREAVQALVTLCADCCQPHKLDAGPERASALQSLRAALGTGLMGARAEFCMLFAAGAALSQAHDFVRAARTTHLLRQMAELDHQLVQDAFGEGGWPIEFRAAVARLLSQHAPNDKEAPISDVPWPRSRRLDLSLSQQMVRDLIVLVGFVVVNNPQLHETICENWGVIKTLCTLPANWLVSELHSPELLPTLVVLAERPATARDIRADLNVQMLESYMNSREGQKMKLIQLVKAGREKAIKKDKLGKKEKHNSTGDNSTKKDTTNSRPNENINGILTNGIKQKNKATNNSDDESTEDEV